MSESIENSEVTKFNPETVELTPYFERQQQAAVTDEDLDAAKKAWEKDPPELEGEDVTLILDSEATSLTPL